MPTRPPAHSVQLLKAKAGCAVWIIQRPGEERRVLKRWMLTPWLAVKLPLGIAQPQRQIRGARRLERAGINTPRVEGGLRLGLSGMIPAVCVEMEHANGQNIWDWLKAGIQDDESALAVAKRIGSIVAQMSSSGLFNRDLKLENLIAEVSEAGVVVSVVDPVGVRRSRNAPVEIARMLDRLAIQPARFGLPVPAVLRIACIRAALRPLPRSRRREVIRRLRLHPAP